MKTRVRLAVLFLVQSLLLVPVSAQYSVRLEDNYARSLFFQARATLGLSEVFQLKSLVFKGRSKSLDASGSMADADVDIHVLVPDKYLRIDSALFGDKLTGFAGSELLSLVRADGRMTAPGKRDRDRLLRSEKVRLLRLLIGAAMYVPSDNLVYFRSVGNSFQPVAGELIATQPPEQNRLAVKTDKGSVCEVIFDTATHLPASLVYFNLDGTELTMTFADRRPTGGLLLPYRITTSTGGRTIDELTFDQILVNTDIESSYFTNVSAPTVR